MKLLYILFKQKICKSFYSCNHSQKEATFPSPLSTLLKLHVRLLIISNMRNQMLFFIGLFKMCECFRNNAFYNYIHVCAIHLFQTNFTAENHGANILHPHILYLASQKIPPKQLFLWNSNDIGTSFTREYSAYFVQ